MITEPADERRTERIRSAAAFVFFLVITAIAMQPVLGTLHVSVIGWLGDNVQYAYMFGWTAEAILTGQSPFTDPQLNYPGSLALDQTDTPFLTLAALTPLTAATTPVLSYNMALLLSHVLTGFFVYLWLRRVTGSHLGGLVAGVAFTLAPYRIVHSYGHLNLASTQYLVLFFWAVDEAVSATELRWRQLLYIAGASLLVAGASSLYYWVFGLLGAAAYALFYLGFRTELLRRGWRIAIAIGLAGILGAIPYLLGADRAYTAYAIEDIRVWSADLADFLAPSRLHPLWGEWIASVYPRATWIEHTLYLGVTPSLLALSALFPWGRPMGRRRWVWLGLVVFSLVLALGTDLHALGQTYGGDNPFWLPAYYLVQLPVIELVRVWSRMAVVASLFISLLAGAGAAAILRRQKRPAFWAGAILALILLEFWPGQWTTAQIRPRAVDAWLAEQPGAAAGFLPAGEDNYLNAYGSLFHDKRLPAYIHPHHLPEEYKRYQEISGRFPAPEAVQELQELGFSYLVLRRDAYDGVRGSPWEYVSRDLDAMPQLRRVADLEQHTVYAFVTEP